MKYQYQLKTTNTEMSNLKSTYRAIFTHFKNIIKSPGFKIKFPVLERKQNSNATFGSVAQIERLIIENLANQNQQERTRTAIQMLLLESKQNFMTWVKNSDALCQNIDPNDLKKAQNKVRESLCQEYIRQKSQLWQKYEKLIKKKQQLGKLKCIVDNLFEDQSLRFKLPIERPEMPGSKKKQRNNWDNIIALKEAIPGQESTLMTAQKQQELQEINSVEDQGQLDLFSSKLKEYEHDLLSFGLLKQENFGFSQQRNGISSPKVKRMSISLQEFTPEQENLQISFFQQ